VEKLQRHRAATVIIALVLDRTKGAKLAHDNRPKKGGKMKLTEKHLEYWRKNVTITSILLGIWFVSTFVVGWFSARTQQRIHHRLSFGFLHVGPGLPDHLCSDNLVLSALHE